MTDEDGITRIACYLQHKDTLSEEDLRNLKIPTSTEEFNSFSLNDRWEYIATIFQEVTEILNTLNSALHASSVKQSVRTREIKQIGEFIKFYNGFSLFMASGITEIFSEKLKTLILAKSHQLHQALKKAQIDIKTKDLLQPSAVVLVEEMPSFTHAANKLNKNAASMDHRPGIYSPVLYEEEAPKHILIDPALADQRKSAFVDKLKSDGSPRAEDHLATKVKFNAPQEQKIALRVMREAQLRARDKLSLEQRVQTDTHLQTHKRSNKIINEVADITLYDSTESGVKKRKSDGQSR